jgi:tRNA pseudouridine55 synthase
MPIHLIDKPEGQTPLQALKRLQQTQNLSGPLTYAGRLDPMASGLLIVLGAPDHLQKEQWLALDKVYKAVFLVGAGSDSGDILGLVERGKPYQGDPVEALKSLKGEQLLKVPVWSSVPVAGKSLVRRLRQGEQVEAPFRKMRVDGVEEIEIKQRSLKELAIEAELRIRQVEGEFRQEQAVESWKRLEDVLALLISATISCGSGCYIRSLAVALGERLQSKALLWSLRRTQVGAYRL